MRTVPSSFEKEIILFALHWSLVTPAHTLGSSGPGESRSSQNSRVIAAQMFLMGIIRYLAQNLKAGPWGLLCRCGQCHGNAIVTLTLAAGQSLLGVYTG